ncbi:MAG: DEAD/DEAH box helicase [Planctomycetaceae bacterium]|jgi:ATP-dependent RNA helicase DeaD|nr:DEAD/DEAH box helicase [Planctomycetaceae bacterium]
MVITKNNKENTDNNRNNNFSTGSRTKRKDRRADLVDSFQWGFVEGADNEEAYVQNDFHTQDEPPKKSKIKTAAKTMLAPSGVATISPKSHNTQADNISPNSNTTANSPKRIKKRVRQTTNDVSVNVVGKNLEKAEADSSSAVVGKSVLDKTRIAKNLNSKSVVKKPRRKITVNFDGSTALNPRKTKGFGTKSLFESFEEDDLNLPSYGRTYRGEKSCLDRTAKKPETANAATTPQPSKKPNAAKQTPPPNRSAGSETRNIRNIKSDQGNLNNNKGKSSLPSSPSIYTKATLKVPKQDSQTQQRGTVVQGRNLSPIPTSVYSVLPHELPKPKKEQMVWDPDKREYVPLDFSLQPLPSQQLPNQQLSTVSPPSKVLPVSPATTHRQPTPPTPATKQNIAPVPRENKIAVKPSQKKISPAVTVVDKFIGKKLAAEVVDSEAAGVVKADNQLRKGRQQRGDISRLVMSKRPDPADIETDASGFSSLGLSDVMLEALRILRYVEPTPIQAGVFEQVKAGKDIMGQAQTGTGKTAAFSIPIIEGIEECQPGNEPVALILVPTRELAVQVRDEVVRLSYGREIRTAACYGGKPIVKQIAKLSEGIDVVVGTPGRVLDLMNRRVLVTDSLKWVVLDEADRMLDIGFRPDIEKILKKSPAIRQTLLFSATLPPPVVKLAERYMREPEVLDFSNKGVSVDTIEQFYVTVDQDRKFDALVYLLSEECPNQAIIFTRTKRGADRLARLLSKQIASLSAIHGDLQQVDRDRIMSKFRAGELRYLVATDVVGRGIDVSGISHIINYDIPHFCDDYVHRVGRTGRMGRDGVAFTFVTAEEGNELTRIEMRIEKLLKRADLKGFESFSKPVENEEKDENRPTNNKPVFGKPVRKIRRAL